MKSSHMSNYWKSSAGIILVGRTVMGLWPTQSFISFPHLNGYLVSVYCVPGTVMGIGDTNMNETVLVPVFVEITFQSGKHN